MLNSSGLVVIGHFLGPFQKSQFLSTGERPITLVLSDLRFWVIHVVTISSLFLSGSIVVVSGLVYKIFGAPTLSQFFSGTNQIPSIADRYSALNGIEDF